MERLAAIPLPVVIVIFRREARLVHEYEIENSLQELPAIADLRVLSSNMQASVHHAPMVNS